MKQVEEFLGSLAEVALKDFLEGAQERAKNKTTVQLRLDALDRALHSFDKNNTYPESSTILARAAEFAAFLQTGKGPAE